MGCGIVLDNVIVGGCDRCTRGKSRFCGTIVFELPSPVLVVMFLERGRAPKENGENGVGS